MRRSDKSHIAPTPEPHPADAAGAMTPRRIGRAQGSSGRTAESMDRLNPAIRASRASRTDAPRIRAGTGQSRKVGPLVNPLHDVTFAGEGTMSLTATGKRYAVAVERHRNARAGKPRTEAAEAVEAMLAQHGDEPAATLRGTFSAVNDDGTVGKPQATIRVKLADWSDALRSIVWAADRQTVERITVAQRERGRPTNAAIGADSALVALLTGPEPAEPAEGTAE